MENVNYGRELNAPPRYESPSYEPLKEEVEFRSYPGQNVQSTVVTIMPDGPPVRDHLIWSLFNTMYLNFCCLGLLALVFSVKSRDRKLYGDKNGAASYGSTARSLNIASTVLAILSVIILITIAIVQITQVQQWAANSRQYEENNPFGK
ncbi:dispanin subfamily A member 2b-like [Bufo bufo]|uniref:dispanin subfamily A member 2b-like n=1 Tax=Bufo bufo TaxID=8384 RepID=UPI001ABE6AEF|nr:dispanin subfamily A member 2b-like [Bufo bufo]XP_040265000.1 dispanin subfamily A member 2b-like [Bufo bufo]